MVTDDELTDAWEAGTVFTGGISHLHHLRIAWILHRRHRPKRARVRLHQATKQARDLHRYPQKFDAALTARCAQAVAEAIDRR